MEPGLELAVREDCGIDVIPSRRQVTPWQEETMRSTNDGYQSCRRNRDVVGHRVAAPPRTVRLRRCSGRDGAARCGASLQENRQEVQKVEKLLRWREVQEGQMQMQERSR